MRHIRGQGIVPTPAPVKPPRVRKRPVRPPAIRAETFTPPPVEMPSAQAIRVALARVETVIADNDTLDHVTARVYLILVSRWANGIPLSAPSVLQFASEVGASLRMIYRAFEKLEELGWIAPGVAKRSSLISKYATITML